MQLPHTTTPGQILSSSPRNLLCDQGTGSGTLVSPSWGENTDGLVVTGETVDAGLNENQTKLGVLILSVSLEMLTNSYGLLDQHVQVFWDLWGEAIGLENSENLVTSDNLNLCDTVRISENNTDLRGGCSLLCKFADLVDNLFRRSLQPCRRSPRVGDGGG